MAAHKDECPGGAGQFAESSKSYASNFIAFLANYANANAAFSQVFLSLALQFSAVVWGVL